jgi:hypothetical protein
MLFFPKSTSRWILFLFSWSLFRAGIDGKTPTQPQLDTITEKLQLVMKGGYPGTTRMVRRKDRVVPVWNQRTAILHYNRNLRVEPLVWMVLSMGVFSNYNNLISNKKRWMNTWRDANPERFLEMEERFLPRSWSDIESLGRDVDESKMYVYKPVLGSQGIGIKFLRGQEMYASMASLESAGTEWVVQEFIDPFLFLGKKTHMRTLTLAIVQPDGSRDFFIYDRMRLYTASEDFDEDRLMSDRDNTHMLLTNSGMNKLFFESKPENRGKTYDRWETTLDAQTALAQALAANSSSALGYDYVYSESRRMHSLIYSIIGDVIDCRPTDISVYNESCFHVFGSDIAFDKHHRLYLLEMNHRMGYTNVWRPEEQVGIARGVASLIRGTASPYKAGVGDSSVWERLDL